MAEERLTLTIEQAAGLAGISRSLAYDLARRGELPGVVRLGRRLLVSRVKFVEFLSGDGAGSPPPALSPIDREKEHGNAT